MLILGLNCYLHDASACLLSDGKIVAFAEEERFNRKKHYGGLPKLAIEYCLKEAGVKLSEVDHVGYYWHPWKGLVQRGWYMLKHPVQSFKGEGRESDAPRQSVGLWVRMVTLQKTLEKEFEVPAGKLKLHWVDHHLAHAASAFFVSPFDKSDILTIDASGEWDTCLKLKGAGNRMEVVHRISNPNTLGTAYSGIAQYLGFPAVGDEGKVMGLSSYGEESYREFFDELIRLEPDGMFRTDDTYFALMTMNRPYLYAKKLIDRFGPPRRKDEPIKKFHEDFAASLQHMTNRTGLHMAKDLHARTGNKNLCLAGGVALSCVMNGHILTHGPHENIYIQAAAADNGTSLGSALYIHHQLLGKPRDFVMEHPYWGPSYSDDVCEAALKKYGVPYRKVENVEAAAAKWLSAGKIVGWFQGRMEVGPRALGNRSILADPRRAEMKDILNKRVKHREGFRPFAPSVLAEKSTEYFETRGHPSPFMLFAVDVKKEKQSVVPAITHVDGTGRVQTITKDYNPRYYGLIAEFGRRTGVPVVLNTSFNVMGEPIVCTPDDAVRCYVGTGIDCLAIGNFLTEKPPTP